MFKKIIIIIIVLFVIFSLISVYFINSITKPCNNLSGNKEFIINKGERVNQISQNLKKEGFICSSFIFETYVWLTGKETKFKAGSHYLPKKSSIRQLVNLLITGKSMENEITIKVIEGKTIKEIAGDLDNLGVASKENFLKAAKPSPDYKFDFLLENGDNIKTLEGYLFPDTYRIYRTATAEDIISKMLDNFNKKLTPDLRAEIKKQNKSIFQIIIMASIIEKEARDFEDKKKIADIFWRRIKEGIDLQADSTVNYITGKKDPGVSYDDAKLDNPYNTYKYRGLPPGPICNPGLDSIKAAIYPEKNDYWYFLSAKDDGKIIYSKNFAEHNLNKAKYLK